MFLRGQTLGKYRILSHLGSGGFGSVYLAEDIWIDKKVALKVPHRQHHDFTEMLKEPRLLASMSHPNIVTMLTAERVDDVFFIVLEYVAGETLEQLIMREGALDLMRALDFTCQICNAVDHAHRAGVLHRDLRPGNMLLSETGLLKVTDFGTSRLLESAALGTTVIGSPPYMAPEQFYGKAVFASDIYSIGVTMYQMLTGELPYNTPAPADIERLVRGELTVPPRAKNARIPKAINEIVLRAMAPDVKKRYQRASDLLEDVLATRPAALKTRRHTTKVPAVPQRPARVRQTVSGRGETRRREAASSRSVTRPPAATSRRADSRTQTLKGRAEPAPTRRDRRETRPSAPATRGPATSGRSTVTRASAAPPAKRMKLPPPSRTAGENGAPSPRAAAKPPARGESVTDIHSRLRARAVPPARFCWHCRKPLHARADRCPFCNEIQ